MSPLRIYHITRRSTNAWLWSGSYGRTITYHVTGTLKNPENTIKIQRKARTRKELPEDEEENSCSRGKLICHVTKKRRDDSYRQRWWRSTSVRRRRANRQGVYRGIDSVLAEIGLVLAGLAVPGCCDAEVGRPLGLPTYPVA